MNLFEAKDYKTYVRMRLSALPKRGHGQYARIAKLLGIHTTMTTHIFKGDSNLSVEQALKLGAHFALTPLETEYFVTLVQLERAANLESRRYFQKQLTALKTRALDLRERLQSKATLDEHDQAIFYSSWHYSAIRLLCATQNFGTPEPIAETLGLSTAVVTKALAFLLEVGLLREEAGRFTIGETLTYIGRDSHFVGQHHANWRQRALAQLDDIPAEDLVFTSAIALSRADHERVRELLVRTIESFKKIGDPSPSEEVCFLTIDWRRLRLRDSN